MSPREETLRMRASIQAPPALILAGIMTVVRGSRSFMRRIRALVLLPAPVVRDFSPSCSPKPMIQVRTNV